MVYWTAFQLNVLLVYPIVKLILWQSFKKKKSKCKVAEKHNCLIPCLNNLGMFVA